MSFYQVARAACEITRLGLNDLPDEFYGVVSYSPTSEFQDRVEHTESHPVLRQSCSFSAGALKPVGPSRAVNSDSDCMDMSTPADAQEQTSDHPINQIPASTLGSPVRQMLSTITCLISHPASRRTMTTS